MTVSTREYAWMALDAYDARNRTNDPDSRTFADPAVELEFPRFEVEGPRNEAALLRNATVTQSSGFEANIYTDSTANEIVVAFRGTEFGRFLDALDNNQFGLIDEANVDRDTESLFGYFQDGGATVSGFVDDAGGFEEFLEDVLGFGNFEADALSGVLDFFSLLGDPVEELAEDGEGVVRAQAEEAIQLVLETAAANPGAEITVTGHSLGGALAAYVAAALGVPAVVFDPAPYAEETFLPELRDLANQIVADAFPGLDLASFGWQPTLGPLDAAAGLVETQRLEGSFVPELYLTASPLINIPQEPRRDTVIDLGDGDAITLHSPDLLTLAVDSAALETADRPSLETLAGFFPTLIVEADRDRFGPNGRVDSFFRTLLVEEELYDYFATLLLTVENALAAYAPDGSGGETLREGVRTELFEQAFLPFGRAVGDEATDALPEAEALAAPSVDGAENVVALGTYTGIDVFGFAGDTRDTVGPGAGSPDFLIGTIAELDRTTVLDWGTGDTIVVNGRLGEPFGLEIGGGETVVRVGDPSGNEARVTILEELDPLLFGAFEEGGTTRIVYDGGRTLSADEVRTVALLYEAILGRQADTEGLNFYVDEREAGFSEFAVTDALLRSAEFAGLQGAFDEIDDATFLLALYESTFGRVPDEAGEDFWLGSLASGYARQNVARDFARSPENEASAVSIGTLTLTEPGIWDFA
ncbi:MAG: YqiA/YcfP family alpha/beta fold hydrolase [Pseudomonadota bacterium]